LIVKAWNGSRTKVNSKGSTSFSTHFKASCFSNTNIYKRNFLYMKRKETGALSVMDDIKKNSEVTGYDW